MWSLATLEYPDHEIYRALAARVTVDRARFFKPQELSNTVWALATAEVTPKYPDIYDNVLIQPRHHLLGALQAIDDPVTLAFGLAAQELMRRPLEFKPQEIKDVLWSFSKVRTTVNILLYHGSFLLIWVSFRALFRLVLDTQTFSKQLQSTSSEVIMISIKKMEKVCE